jgi:DNA-binding MarR family transcriptional regulator
MSEKTGKPKISPLDFLARYNQIRNFIDPSDEVMNSLVEAAAYSGNSRLLQTAEKILTYEAIPQIIVQDPFFPPPEPEQIAGKFQIGHSLPHMYPYGLSPGQVSRNIQITGTVGKGKTVTILKIIQNLYKCGIPFLVVSVAKKDFRGLIRNFPKIQVIRAEDLRMNLLQTEEWSSPLGTINFFVDIYSHGAEVMLRSKSLISKNLAELFDSFGKNRGNDIQPNLEDMLSLLKVKTMAPGFKRDDFIQRNIDRIEALLLLSSNIFRCSVGFELEKILENPVILELEGLSDTVINFIMIYLLTKILKYRIEKGELGKLKHCLIFDEAKRIFDNSQEKNIHMGIPPIDYLVSYGRELGEGFIAADQELTKLTDTLSACTSTKIAFQVSGKNIEEVKKVFGLNEPQVEVLRQLPCGTAIVKDEKCPRPFLAQMDYIEIDKGLPDLEVEEHSKKFIEWLNEDVRPRSTLLIECIKKEEKKREISKEEEIFLIHVAKRPELAVVERFEAIGLSNYKGNKIQSSLFYKGFIKKVQVQSGQKGRQKIIVEITEKGKEYLNAAGIKTTAKGRGGAGHQFWQKKIKEFYEKRGQEAVIEPNHDGVNTDVLVFTKEGKRMAVEVALSIKGQVKNIQRDLQYFDKVLMASETQKLKEKIHAEARKVLGKDDTAKVSYCLLKEFLK